MKPCVHYYRSARNHIRSLACRAFCSLLTYLCQKKQYGITAVFVTEQKDDVWLSHYRRLLDCAVQIIEKSSLTHDIKLKLHGIKTVYVMNHSGNTGNAFFGKAFILFHLPERKNTMESVWDLLYYMIGFLVYTEYYINQCIYLKESKALSLRDTTEILSGLAPIIRDVVSERLKGSPVEPLKVD